MFEGCKNLIDLNLVGFDLSRVASNATNIFNQSNANIIITINSTAVKSKIKQYATHLTEANFKMV